MSSTDIVLVVLFCGMGLLGMVSNILTLLIVESQYRVSKAIVGLALYVIIFTVGLCWYLFSR